jgi:hypothetical protein
MDDVKQMPFCPLADHSPPRYRHDTILYWIASVRMVRFHSDIPLITMV